MKNSGWMVVGLLTGVLAACGEGAVPVPEDGGSAARDSAGSTAPRTDERVEVPTSREGGEPLLVGSGGIVAAEISAPQAGDVVGVGVQVGNFGGTSDGMMTIKLCQAEKCVEGSSDLSVSVDNEYLMLDFARPLGVTAGTPLAITIGRVGGVQQFALWTYPATTTMTAPDGVTSQRVPKTALVYLR